MELTKEQQEILNGSQGEQMAKVMKTLVQYGDTFHAGRLVPITSTYGHLVTSFGLNMMSAVHELMDQLIDSGTVSKQKFTVDPRPMDPNVPSNPLQDVVFRVMYSKQNAYERQLKSMGLLNKDGFTCTCYMEEVGNIPREGDILSWAESSAVVYANSVLGARCNRNSGIIEMFGSIAGLVPEFGLLTDEGRKASWIVKVKTTQKPEAQLLGSAIGMKVMEDVPWIEGLDQWLGTELNQSAKDYLKDMGAATASNGAVGLFHVAGLTPEARRLKEDLILENAQEYVIDDAELQRVKASYPIMWKNPEAKAKLAFIGCPHLSFDQLNDWTQRIRNALILENKDKVAVDTVLTAAPAVAARFKTTSNYSTLTRMGVVLSSICPLMYMNNPLCGRMPVITCSNKLRTYTSSRYCTEEELLKYISSGRRPE